MKKEPGLGHSCPNTRKKKIMAIRRTERAKRRSREGVGCDNL